jgi:exosome complex component RRP4
MKRIVVPGEVVTTERKRVGEHVFISDGKILADTIGIVSDEASTVSVIPLQGKYMPVAGDLVVGVVAQDLFSGYIVDINSFYYSFVSKKDIRDVLKLGSVISAKIESVNEINEADLSNVRVFYGGEILSVSPVKVPRMIGKNGSMLEVLKRGTGCNIMIGRNGRIWVKGGNIELLIVALKKIEEEAHLSNLTNRMTEFLDAENKKARPKTA